MGDTAAPQAPAGGLGAAPGAGPRVHSAIVERLRARIAVCRRHHRSCEGRYERGRAESSDRERQSTRQLLSLVQHGQAARRTPRPARAAAPAPHAPHAPPRAHLPDAPTAAASGDPRPAALLALQGSLRRKQALPSAPAHSKRPNGFAHSDFLEVKRICVGDAPGVGQGPLQANNGQSPVVPGTLPLSQIPARNPGAPPAPPAAPPPPTDSLSSLGLKPVKKEPGEALSCSRHLDGAFGQQLGEEPAELLMDPELQELFNELSSISVPPLSDLEPENMISAAMRQGDPFGLDLGQLPGQRSPPAGPPLAPDKPIVKSESSGLGQAASGCDPQAAPQLRSTADSPAFSVATPALPAAAPLSSVPQGQPQPVPGTVRGLPSWQVSHAQQLKQIAANRQHQAYRQPPPSKPTAWSALPCPAGATAAFGQEKTPNAAFTQQPFIPQSSPTPGGTGGSGQSTVLGNCVLKAGPPAPGGTPQSTAQEITRGFTGTPHSSTKILFHFSPEPGGQQPPPTLASPSKCLTHYPAPAPAQPAPPLPGTSLLRSALPGQQTLLQKMQNPTLTGLGYQVSPQHRQEQQQQQQQQLSAASPSPCSNPCPSGGFLSAQPSLLTQPLVGKKPAVQRPEQKQKLPLPTPMLADAEKVAVQDQMSRHLSRPPPDYKEQRRNAGSMSSGAAYPGPSSTASLSSGPALANPVSTQPLGTPSSSLTPAPGTRLPPVSTAVPNQTVGTFASLSCSQSGQYSTVAGLGQLVPQRNLPPMGPTTLAPRPPPLAPSASGSCAPFTAVSVGPSPQPRVSLPPSMASLAPQRAPTEMPRPATAAPPGWAPQETPAKPQEAPKPASVGFPTVTRAAYAPNQALPQVVVGQPFPQPAAAPTNPLAPAVQMRPLSHVTQTVNGQGLGSLRGLSLRPGPLSAPVMPALNPPTAALSQAAPQALSAGSFPSPGQSSRPLPGSEHCGAGLAFDFLSPQGDGLGPALNSDADFIDSLLKSEPGNDDWMRDINLDEILGSHL